MSQGREYDIGQIFGNEGTAANLFLGLTHHAEDLLDEETGEVIRALHIEYMSAGQFTTPVDLLDSRHIRISHEGPYDGTSDGIGLQYNATLGHVTSICLSVHDVTEGTTNRIIEYDAPDVSVYEPTGEVDEDGDQLVYEVDPKDLPDVLNTLNGLLIYLRDSVKSRKYEIIPVQSN